MNNLHSNSMQSKEIANQTKLELTINNTKVLIETEHYDSLSDLLDFVITPALKAHTFQFKELDYIPEGAQ
jgi:hypothetical protein